MGVDEGETPDREMRRLRREKKSRGHLPLAMSIMREAGSLESYWSQN